TRRSLSPFSHRLVLTLRHGGLTYPRQQISAHASAPLPPSGKALRWMRMMTTQQSKPHCKRGDVILVLFPNSDLRTAKLRPALMIQADDLQTGLAQVIVAMITSNVDRATHPSRILIR